MVILEKMSAFVFPSKDHEMCPTTGYFVPKGDANYTGFHMEHEMPGGLPYDLPDDHIWNKFVGDFEAEDARVKPNPPWVFNDSTNMWQPPENSAWVINVDTGRYEPPKSAVAAPETAVPETAIVANEPPPEVPVTGDTESEEEKDEQDEQEEDEQDKHGAMYMYDSDSEDERAIDAAYNAELKRKQSETSEDRAGSGFLLRDNDF